MSIAILSSSLGRSAYRGRSNTVQAPKRSALNFVLLELESLLFILRFKDKVNCEDIKQTLAIIKRAWRLLVCVQSHICI